MAKPALDKMRRNKSLKSVNAKPMTQSFRHCRSAADSGSDHNFFHASPRSCTAPFPDPPIGRIWIALAPA